MGLWDSIKSFGSKIFRRVREGIQKVIPIVKRLAPVVQKVAEHIPHPMAQTIGKGAGIVGGLLGNDGGG